MGRPSDFSQELADTICSRLAEGESLREVCRDDDLPNVRTVLRWVGQHRSFEAQYREAREAMEMHFLEEMKSIATDGTNDWVDRQNRDGSTTRVFDHEHVQRSKLRVETLRSMLAMMSPKKYGFKAGSGIEPAASEQPVEKKEISDLDRAKALCFLLNKVGGAKIVPSHAVVFVPVEGTQPPAHEKMIGFAQLMSLKLVDPAEAWSRVPRPVRIEPPVREPVALPPSNSQFIETTPVKAERMSIPTGFMNGSIT